MIKTNTIELSGCPCCGSPPVIQRRYPDNGSVTIRCSKRGCGAVMGQGVEDAAEIWNLGRFTDPYRWPGFNYHEAPSV